MGDLPANFFQGFGGFLAATVALLGGGWLFYKLGRPAANEPLVPPSQAEPPQGIDPAVVAAIAASLGQPAAPPTIDPAVVAAIAASLKTAPPTAVATPTVVAAIAAKLAR